MWAFAMSVLVMSQPGQISHGKFIGERVYRGCLWAGMGRRREWGEEGLRVCAGDDSGLWGEGRCATHDSRNVLLLDS